MTLWFSMLYSAHLSLLHPFPMVILFIGCDAPESCVCGILQFPFEVPICPLSHDTRKILGSGLSRALSHHNHTTTTSFLKKLSLQYTETPSLTARSTSAT
mmetsp:Transcript_10333/g.21732  ORF Transcript_10333/g.21732 Transcript_10333/m.21732 type:complete len:100 (-) Transcript_10333:34-333(-)